MMRLEVDTCEYISNPDHIESSHFFTTGRAWIASYRIPVIVDNERPMECLGSAGHCELPTPSLEDPGDLSSHFALSFRVCTGLHR